MARVRIASLMIEARTSESQGTSPAPPHEADTRELEHVPCTGCGADEPEFVLETAEFRHAKGERFRVVRCGACGHLYTNPRPTAGAIGRYYPDQYYESLEAQPANPRPRGLHHGWRERAARYALRQHFGYPGPTPRSFLRRSISWPAALWLRYGRRTFDMIPWAGEGKLCDFGCGSCGFLILQRRRGWQCCGVDFNAHVAQWANERHDLEVAVGSWPGEAMAGRTFDAISAWHVVEHVPDPVAFVRAAVEKLNPGGLLLVCCPDADSWGFRWFGADWHGLDVPRHFSHFTKQKLVELLTDAGLVVQRVRGQVRAANLRDSARIRAERTGSRFWRLMGKFNFFWRQITMLSAWFRKADGVIIIARKP